MKKILLAAALMVGAASFAVNSPAAAPAAGDAGTQEHKMHEGHTHKHGKKCGHKAEKHADHVDYEHDGHHHKMHDGHADECEGPEATKKG